MTKIMHVVSLSGGKDSTATMLLALEQQSRESLRFVFADTGNEHEATYEYVMDYLQAALDIRIDVVRADFSEEFATKRANLARICRRRAGVGRLWEPGVHVLLDAGGRGPGLSDPTACSSAYGLCE